MIPSEKSFVLKDGTKIKGLRELASILPKLDENTFTHHVNEEKNDFANWIEEVFKNATLADKIKDITSPTIIAAIIKIYLSKKELERDSEKEISSLMK